MARTRIGISGRRYAPWRRVFYPAGLVQRDELAYGSRQFPKIEVNGSFYSLQRPESYLSWYGATGDPRIAKGAPCKRAERDIHIHFDNDIKVKAPFDTLARDGLVR